MSAEQQQPEKKVSTLSVLKILDDRGPRGEIASVIASEFTIPLKSQRRNSHVNQILRTLQHSDKVLRSTVPESSLVYHNVPVYRWFITDAGREYSRIGGRPGTLAAYHDRVDELKKSKDSRIEHRKEVITSPWEFVAKPAPGCVLERYHAITGLRSHGLSLLEIGMIISFTRERARQVIKAGVPACRCMNCAAGKNVPSLPAFHPRHVHDKRRRLRVIIKSVLIAIIITYRLIPAPVRHSWSLGGSTSGAALTEVRAAATAQSALSSFIFYALPRPGARTEGAGIGGWGWPERSY
jgi:hypothetical protein